MNSRTLVAIVGVVALAAIAIGGLYFLGYEPEWPEDDSEYTAKTIDAYMYSTDEKDKKTIDIRYYADSPNVPYVDVSQYYKLLQKESISARHKGDGVFTLENERHGAGSATLDTNVPSLTSKDYYSFTAVTDVNYIDDSDTWIPFVKGVSDKVVKACQPVTIDLSKYGIKVHLDKENRKVWMPFQTVADIFSGSANYYAEYLRDAVYFTDIRTVTENGLYLNDEKYLKRLVDSLYIDTDRPADLVEYNYNELCLLFDNFYGNPGKGELCALIKERGLDYALSHHDDTAGLIRDYLKSADSAEYLSGLESLYSYLYDGGHTNTSIWSTSVFDTIRKNGDIGFLERVAEMKSALEPPTHPDRSAAVKILRELRDESWEGMETLAEGFRYYEQGDTAVFSFDSFSLDFDGWDNYTSDGWKLPKDTIGCLYTALKKADSNPAIKKFVLDLSTNGGGYVADVMFINSLLTGKDTNESSVDVLTEQTVTSVVAADVNLDGKFNDKDHEKQFRFDYGILTSSCSFSSGNMLPVISQRDGIMILGQTSGGGSCSITVVSSADALPITMSSTIKSVVGYGEEGYDQNTVEFGAKPDHTLVKENPDGSFDYSGFYDIDAISRAMSQFYAS
ncbi:MAG: hypothetical protein IJ856_02110 [Candidatus Methanomethylophilaceae archaeon]|nr:hypothetical protein [Candidatus Methanomethylophilaceae archaeon]